MASRRNPALIFIFITLLIDITGLGIIIPVMPTLIRELTGVSLSDAAEYGGWLLFAFAVMQFLSAPVLGNLSDRFGRRPVLLASLFGFMLDYILLAVAPTIGWLFAGRVIAGIMGASITTAMAYIADVSSPEKRSQNFGMIGAAFGLGFIIGPVIGGVLGEYGPRIPFVAAAVLSGLNWLYGFFILPESLPMRKRRRFDLKRANPLGSLQRIRKNRIVKGLTASLFLIYIASHAVQSTWSYFTMYRFSWSEGQVGYSLGFAGLLVGLVQGLLIRVVTPRIGQKNSVFAGMWFYFIGLVCFAFATQGWMMYLFLLPYCLGGIAGPALQGIMSNQVPDNEQGELQGGLASIISLTSIIGPPLMTTLFAVFTGGSEHVSYYFPGAAFIIAAVLALASNYQAGRSLKAYTG